MASGLFDNDVFICLRVVEDDCMTSSVSAMAPVAVVGADAIISLVAMALLMTADIVGWLSLSERIIALLSVTDDNGADSCIISK